MESILPENEASLKISKSNLIKKGFHFNYQTQQRQAKKGTYFYCYDYGYLEVEKDIILIVGKQ